MDVQTIQAKMTDYVAPARACALAQVCGWTFEVDAAQVYVELKHRRKPESVYLLRISFEDFPRRAPSYLFVDRESKNLTPAAWPPNVKHEEAFPGICTPGTREFHERYHLNDAQYPWDPDRYTFTDTLHRIQQLMEHGVGG